MTGRAFRQILRKLAVRAPQRVIDANAKEAAVAVMLAPGRSGGLETLLIQRATRQGDPWSGQVAFPGGRRAPADSALLVTAIRETMEEVSVLLRESDLLGELDDVHPRTRTLPPMVVRPFVFGLEARPDVDLSSEVASHRWVGLTQLMTPGAYTETVIPALGRSFPAYRLDDFLIWGMTERIITPLLDLALTS